MRAVSRDDPFVPQLYRVMRRTPEGADTVTLELVPVSLDPPAVSAPPAVPAPEAFLAPPAFPTPATAPSLLPFQPGQFNMLYAFGVGEIAVSLSGDPADCSRIVHTVRAVGAVSSAIVAMGARAIMGIRGPYGTPWPVDEARGRDVVFVAGGLGLAPLRPAIYHVLTHRDLYGKVAILVGMRNPAEILYRPLLEQWRARLDVALEVTVDRSDPTWHGHVGVVPSLVSRVDFDAANAIAMVCGPEIMMRFTINALSDAGMPPERVYLSMERNMKCAIGLCGHCQFGPSFVCKDGPVMSVRRIGSLLAVREV